MSYSNPYCTIDKLRISKANGIRFVYLTSEGSFFESERIEDNEFYNDQSSCGFTWEQFAQKVPCDGVIRFQFQWCDSEAPLVHIFKNNQFYYELTPIKVSSGAYDIYESEINLSTESDLCGHCIDLRIASIILACSDNYRQDSITSNSFEAPLSINGDYSVWADSTSTVGYSSNNFVVKNTALVDYAKFSFISGNLAKLVGYKSDLTTINLDNGSVSTVNLFGNDRDMSEIATNGSDWYTWWGGDLMKSEDFGDSWTVIQSVSTGDYISKNKYREGVLVAGDGVELYICISEGAPSIITPVGYDSYEGIAITASGRIICSTILGYAYSDDNGVSWAYSSISTGITIRDFFVNGGEIYASCSDGNVYLSTNDATTWHVFKSIGYDVLQFCISESNGCITYLSTGKSDPYITYSIREPQYVYHAQSEPIKVQDSGCLMKFEYWNEDDYDSQYFCGGFRNVTYIEAQFLSFRPMETVESYVTSNNRKRIISSNLSKVGMLDIDYAPQYLHEILWRAFGMDNLEIDGQPYTKEGDYEMQENAAKYSLWKASVEVYKNLYKFTNSNCDNCAPITPPPACEGIGCMIIGDTFIVS